MYLSALLLPLIFLIGSGCVTGLNQSLHILGRIRSEKKFTQNHHIYYAYAFVKRLFSENPWHRFLSILNFTKYLLRILYATTFCFYMFAKIMGRDPSTYRLSYSLLSIIIVIIVGLLSDSFFNFIASVRVKSLLYFFAFVSFFFLFVLSPITFPLIKIQKMVLDKEIHRSHSTTNSHVKEKILELLNESELSNYLEPFDHSLIRSVASFRDRIVREIMIPRIDIFTLSIHQTVHEAAKKFISVGHSRIPVYRESVDTIPGVLLYKDVMEYYFHSIAKNDQSPLKTPLKQLLKPVLYTPETKKISHLLQEFRSKQIHLAIVVDEYGGTKGIVTIEDVLEELVGEIADEYDNIEEEQLYAPCPNRDGWIVDAKMSILDIEKELNIAIPQSSEYDTVGGYVFCRSGTIPSKGWKIHNDNFDLEVFSTSERSIEKVIITPSKLST